MIESFSGSRIRQNAGFPESVAFNRYLGIGNPNVATSMMLPRTSRRAGRFTRAPSDRFLSFGLRLARVPVGKEIVRIIAPDKK